MGCNYSCKGVTAIPPTAVQTKIKLLDDVEGTEPEVTNVQKRSRKLVESKSYEKTIEGKPVYKSNKGVKRSQSVKVSAANDTNEVTKIQTTVFRPTSIKIPTLNEHQEINPNTTSNELNKQNLHDDINADSRSNEVKVIKRRATARSVIVESVISNTSDETILHGTTSEKDESGFSYDGVVSSSSSANTEKTMLRQDTFVRFTSARPRNRNVPQETFINDFSSELDESYPIRDSFVTTESDDDEEFSTQENFVRRTTYDTQKSNGQNNTIATDASNDSDVTNLHFEGVVSSISNNSEEMTVPRKAVIRTTFSNGTKSDIHQNPTFYETSSDSYHF